MFLRPLMLTALLFFTCLSYAQLKSPEEFLGYKIGSRYTPHWKIVSYYQYAAAALPSHVRLQQYGETNEHRPLYLAFVSDEKNIANLDNIRMNNLRLANLAKDRMAPLEDVPAIVWLSYNVHGNETSSSEAGMLTFYALLDTRNSQTRDHLKNTVVIIDPCVNPDGRDKYVNWFNSVVGTEYNPLRDAREHREPWPGGRTNHYYFDLNRDWAWQTQLESKQRMAVYNQWLPQVHVDFHEQGINAPYYFAPAAQPYHEVITPWQRSFQETIGKNHAKYFDKNNWLYFTREVFDLFYPSYGDTYPVYNGAIGMTYEQGGGGAAGLGVHTSEGDTLTLFDRVIHHYTTSLSTIEVASLHAGPLVKEFRKFFNNGISGSIGEYKTYVIKTSQQDSGRIQALKELLDRNAIQYGSGSGNARGFNYGTGKEESFNIAAGDLVISAAQPKAAMVKVLFEPQSKLVDSVTYDITAWSLPYVYGLKAFATKEKLAVTSPGTTASIVNKSADAYGYVIQWQGLSSAKTLSQLLRRGVRVRFAEMPFEVNGQQFGRGAIIIVKKGNEKFGSDLGRIVGGICDSTRTRMNAVNTGMVDKGFDFGSSKMHPLKMPKVAILTGRGVGSNAAGEAWFFLEQELRYPVTLVNAEDFGSVDWRAYDVLVLPDGNYNFLSDKSAAADFRQWIEQGGKVIAMENAVLQLSKLDWTLLKARKEDDDEDSVLKKDPYKQLLSFGNRERDYIPGTTPGSIYRVDIDNTHPLMYGYPNYYYTLKMDTNVYDFFKEKGWNAGVIKKGNQIAGFVGHKLKDRLQDGLVFGVQDLGKGSITYLSDNVLFRNFWENGKLMFCNAVFFVGQ
jgi:hypothetical protein